MPGRPNILFITTDQQRYDTLGCTGNPFVRTPNFDGLAARGALFTRCYVQGAVCVPSRSAIATGRYPHQNGCHHMEEVVDATPGLPAYETMFVEHLQDAGYATAAVGKIHIYPDATRGLDHHRLTGGKGARWKQAEGSPLGPGPLGTLYRDWLEAKHRGGYELIYQQPAYRNTSRT